MPSAPLPQLKLDTLIKIDYSSLLHNWGVMDQVLQQILPTVEKRLTENQRQIRALTVDLSNFKLSTQNTLSLLDHSSESRQVGGGGSTQKQQQQKAAEKAMLDDIKAQIKELKTYVVDNQKGQAQVQEIKEKEFEALQKMIKDGLSQSKRDADRLNNQIDANERQLSVLRNRAALKEDIIKTQSVIDQQSALISQLKDKTVSQQNLLVNLNVAQLSQSVITFSKSFEQERIYLRTAFSQAPTVQQINKLEDRIMDMAEFINSQSLKQFAPLSDTKKALIFLQKRINTFATLVFHDGQQHGDPFVTTKSVKCLSCRKDFDALEGKLQHYRPWQVFPSPSKDSTRYPGFGTGFHTVVEHALNKKGVDMSHDDKGRLTSPYNMTREQSSSVKPPPIASSSSSSLGQTHGQSFLPASGGHSQGSIIQQIHQSPLKGSNHNSPNKSQNKGFQVETSFMLQYAKQTDNAGSFKEQWERKQKLK